MNKTDTELLEILRKMRSLDVTQNTKERATIYFVEALHSLSDDAIYDKIVSTYAAICLGGNMINDAIGRIEALEERVREMELQIGKLLLSNIVKEIDHNGESIAYQGTQESTNKSTNNGKSITSSITGPSS